MDTFRQEWWLPPARSELINTFVSQLSLSPQIATILANRRFENVQQAFCFLHPKLEHLHDPMTLPDMGIALQRIYKAVDEKERIVIYGHDDVDGVTSAFILCKVIKDLKGEVSSYIPNRIEEGTGLNFENVSLLAREGAKLLITVDCSVEDRRIVENVHRLSTDIIITDHHEVHDGGALPFPFLNPKRKDSSYGFRDLAGVGVSFKLAQALLLGRNRTVQPFFAQIGDLVALGTLADKVPLVDENRVFTKLGFGLMRERLRPGLDAIVNLFDETDAIQTGFVIRRMIPILSSAHSVRGRNAGFDLLQTQEQNRATQLTRELYGASQEWQRTLLESYRRISEHIGCVRAGEVIFVIDDRSPSGVLGSTASKLMRDFHSPAIILSSYEDRYMGEGRVPKGIDLVDLLGQCRDLLITYGGHKQAAGFSLFPEYVDDFQERLTGLIQDMIVPRSSSRRLDLEIDVSSFDQRFFKEFDLLAPFGRENPNPFFQSRGVRIIPTAPEKVDEQHIRIGTVQTFPLVVSKHQEDTCGKITAHPSAQFDIVFQILTSYGSTPHIFLRDVRRAGSFQHGEHASSSQRVKEGTRGI